MARITTYTNDITISDNDKLIGTDADNSDATKNFKISDLKAYMATGLGTITGTGTINTVPVFTGATAIGNSGLVYTTTGGGSGGNLPLYAFGGSADITVQRIILSDIFCNNISATGAGVVTLNGNTVIGDANTDTLTVNAETTFADKVGIGTTSPSELLHLTGSSAAVRIKNSTFGSGISSVVFETAMGYASSWNLDSRNKLHYSSNHYTGSPSKFVTIEPSAGNVGIGQETPASKLTVTGGDAEVTGSSNGLILESPDGTRYRIKVDNSGNLTTATV